jgi:hypothetical protein
MEIKEAKDKISILIGKFGTAKECQITLPDNSLQALGESEMIIIMLGLAALEMNLQQKLETE